MRRILLCSMLTGSLACEPPTEEDPAPCPSGQVDCDGECIDAIEPRLSTLQDTLFQACDFAGCHGASGPQEMLQMDTAETTHAQLVGVPSVQRPGLERVAPGAPERSYLLNKLRGEDMAQMSSSGGPSLQMPQGAPPFCEGHIEAVEAWIADGAPQN